MRAEPTKRRIWRIFWAWQDEKEERWLRRMANQGWHLRRAGVPVYVFERNLPADVVYRLDYRPLFGDEATEYFAIFRAAHWTHACSLANWHYFRTAAGTGAAPDIFSDTESRIAKYRRLLGVLALLLPLLNVLFFSHWRRLIQPGHGWMETFLHLVFLLQAAITGLLIYAVIRIGMHIRRLRQTARP